MDTTNTDTPEMELVPSPVDGTWGFICRTHGVDRQGLSQRHATNLEAKHVREQHPADQSPVLYLSALAQYALEPGSLGWHAWEVLTGLTGDAAREYAQALQGQSATAAVVPF